MGRSVFFSLILATLVGQIISSTFGKCLVDQRSNLLQFKDGLQFDPAAADKLVNWNITMDCCKWDGVECDIFGHVISLELANQSITIRNEGWKTLFKLQHLEHLNLAWNDFSNATFPVELYNLTNLRYLNFSASMFFGNIPVGLSRLSSLITFDISYSNELLRINNPGSLEVLFRNLTELRELNLDWVTISDQQNSTTAWCDVFSSLSKLQVLSLSGFTISGPICSSLLNLTSLSVLQLDNNKLSTSVPNFLANFSNLTILSLAYCDLRGKFPEKIFQIPTLEKIDLSGNSLILGSFPQFLTPRSLKEMILAYTNFSGLLPEQSIGNLRALSRLDLSLCKFIGPIPTSLGNLSELVYLDLSMNNFNGSIPSFQMSKKLVYTDLSSNALVGTISSAHFESLVDLQYVNLGDNSLSGRLPSSLFALPSLDKLQVSDNQLEGEINQGSVPINIASSSVLTELDLSNNHLSGLIPRFFFNISGLANLDLSFNNFRGNIPDEVGGLANLRTLRLSHNAINGTIPTSISNLTILFSLDLSANQLAGTIPMGMQDLQFLESLNLSYNQLTGEVPRDGRFQTFGESSFIGNRGLCFYPLDLICINDNMNNNNRLSAPISPNANDDEGIKWEYVDAALGFSVGLGTILSLNFFGPRWWQKFVTLIFHFLSRVFGLKIPEKLYRKPIRRL